MSDHHKYCTGGFHPNDIVISGISGRFPMCDSVGELCEALLAKKSLIVQNNDRFEKGAANVPFSSCGTLNEIDKFDAEFFGFPPSQAECTDPAQRILLEVSYEAIVDSGYDPLLDISGKNVGVYTAISNQDAKDLESEGTKQAAVFATVMLRTMFANRCSHVFNFTGPSFTVDSACSSSFVALWSAVHDIRNGRVDAALVNATELCLNPELTFCYISNGIVSTTAECNPFDANANGIVRTEGVTALFIQRASDARRAYASILDIKHAAAGYVPEGICVPSIEQESLLFKDVLNSSGLTANDIDYVEGHGTGTPVGDPIEVTAIKNAYCGQGRNRPVYLGSIKSNIGHTEAAAGICGTIKVILAFESGLISPNYGYSTPNPRCEELLNGTIKVVTEPLPLPSPYVPISSFGFGGSIVHTILKQNSVEYSDDCEVQDMPRLVLFPATTEAAVQSMFDYIEKHPELRSEFFALLNKLSFTPTLSKPIRGYAIYQKNNNAVMQIKNIKHEKRDVWFVMTGMGCQWPGMGLEMMKIPIYAESMKKSAAVLKQFDIDLFEILKKDGKHLLTHRSITPAFVSIAAIQIALLDVLTALEIQPDGIVGHSVGELVCAYADGCCTAEQTLLSAYWRGKSVELSNIPEGTMAAVGLTWEEAVQRCPADVYPACHNAKDSVTISGLKEPVEAFVAELEKNNIFARVVNAYGYPFHCKHIRPTSEKLRKNLLPIFPEPQLRTSRWLSTSYPEDEWENENCKYAGAEYFVHNLISTVRFETTLKKIPSDAITIEIGPHFLLQSILKRSIGDDCTCIGLMKRNNSNNVGLFLESMGKLYIEGLNPMIENLYPPVNFPVPRGTPRISDLIEWNHSQKWHVPKWKPSSGSYIHRINLDGPDNYLLDHFIDGRSLFPATGYIFMAWQAMAKKINKTAEDIDIIVEDFKIHHATVISLQSNPVFSISILDGSGRFEILDGHSVVASGKVSIADDIARTIHEPIIGNDTSTVVPGEDIYNELKIFGYEYGPAFRRLVEVNINGTEGFVEWNDWISFMDALLLFYIFSSNNEGFVLPTGALYFKISPRKLMSSVEDCKNKNFPGIPVNFDANSMICRSMGIEIKKLEVDIAPQHTKPDNSVLEEYKFVPYIHKQALNLNQEEQLDKYMHVCNKKVEEIEKEFGLNLNYGKFKGIERDFSAGEVDDMMNEMTLLTTLQLLLENRKECDKALKKEMYANFNKELCRDLSNSLLVNEYCLRFMFDIISENSSRKLNVLELNHNFVNVLPKVIEFVEKYSAIKFKSKTLVCLNENGIDKSVIDDCNIQLFSYESFSSVAKIKSHSVVITSFGAGIEEVAKELVCKLSSYLEEKGFVLFFHKNFVLPPEKMIASLLGETDKIVSESNLEKLFEAESLVIVSKISDSLGGNLYLLRHTLATDPGNIIDMSQNPNWFDELKSSVADSPKTTWVVSEDNPNSGVIGMINCLRHEPGGDKIRCIFNPTRSKSIHVPPFSFTDVFYKELLKRDLIMNVYKDNSWGSFRHIRIDKEVQSEKVDCSYLTIQRGGDLSSLQWQESPVKYAGCESNESLIDVYYSSLNFKDVMLATGKISATTFAGSYSINLGLEVSGRNKKGQRVAGICPSLGIATTTHVLNDFSFIVPDQWTLEDAATVPVVYSTCYYAMIIRGRLRSGESILIHSGTGGIGLAAINIALSMKCEIYVTVGTAEKLQYLLKTYPSLKRKNIGNSRDASFEDMIMQQTKGRGVDLVLNSLADDLFYASIRCVAKHGRFLEIGKYDLSLDHKIGTKFLLKNITFHGIFLDQILCKDSDKGIKMELRMLLDEGINKGVVKPLPRTVFQRCDAEKAFRYMGGGTHIGKVMFKIRDEEREKVLLANPLHISAIPVTYFYSHKVYIIIGGLGGFGIEVSNWMLSKGAKNVILTSRYGPRTPYHHFCLKRWKENGYNVITSTRDASIKEEAVKLLKEAALHGPVGGIFNSAVVLHDAFLENCNLEYFKDVCAPKADATKHLDVLSRIFCSELDHFVCFSSISCGRGNAGQMNYGYANSVMERICEQRKAENLPGLAIQWGIIGDVGVVHRHMGDDAMIAGVGAQRVKSCLQTLDMCCQLRRPVLSSFVMKDPFLKKGDPGDILQQLARIFGLKDTSEFNALRSFGEMGVDSMIGTEIKHLLETNCDINVTLKELQEMKIGDLRMLIDQSKTEETDNKLPTALVTTTCVNILTSFVHTRPIEPLNDVQHGTSIFILDFECTDISQLSVLAKSMDHPVFAVLWAKETPTSSIENLASWYLKELKKTGQSKMHIVAHSSASVLAFEMALQSQLQEKNIKSITLLDSVSQMVKAMLKEDGKKTSEADILIEFVNNYMPSAQNKLQEQLTKSKTLNQQIRIVVDLFIKSCSQAANKSGLEETLHFHVKKTKLFGEYKPKLKLDQNLLVIEDSVKLLPNDVAELKMLLSEVCAGKVSIQRIPGIDTFTEDSVRRIIPVLKSAL